MRAHSHNYPASASHIDRLVSAERIVAAFADMSLGRPGDRVPDRVKERARRRWGA